MGRCRCLSKPIKRYFFKYADNISKKWEKKVIYKYTEKYINKLNKLNNNIVFDESNAPGLNEFKNSLEINLNREHSLAHCKVREYWLRRGPRLIFILLFTIFITVILSEFFIDNTKNEIIYLLIIGTNMILYNIYMLYQRLIDSIAGAMMRIGHVHYKKWKSEIILDNYISIDIPDDTSSLKITTV